MKRSLAAILLIGETVLFFLIPLSLFVWLLIGELQTLNLDPAVPHVFCRRCVQVIREKQVMNCSKKKICRPLHLVFTKLARNRF